MMTAPECAYCHATHPVNRAHCAACMRPSVFINDSGLCLSCRVVAS